MDICIVSGTVHSYFGSGQKDATGGAERQLSMLAKGLCDRGYDISIVTIKNGSGPQIKTANGIKLHYLIPDTRGVVRAPYKAAKTLQGLRRVGADVYLTRGNELLCMVAATHAQTSRAAFVHAIANDTDVDPNHLAEWGVIQYPYRLALQSADRVIAQTEHQQTLLANHHGVDATQIPNGYDLVPEAELAAHADRGHVLWVGSMDPEQKRPELFLDLARNLPDVQFRMIGPAAMDDPDHYDVIKTRAESIQNLEFLGFVDPDKIHDHYRTAIALVNTSAYEGFPNTFLEAWRYATPVVSLEYTLDGVLNDEQIGIHSGSTTGLVKAVEALATEESLREQLGTLGRKHVAESYSFGQLLDRYERVFTDVSVD